MKEHHQEMDGPAKLSRIDKWMKNSVFLLSKKETKNPCLILERAQKNFALTSVCQMFFECLRMESCVSDDRKPCKGSFPLWLPVAVISFLCLFLTFAVWPSKTEQASTVSC